VKARNAQCAHICHSVFAKSTSALSCFYPSKISDDVNCRVPGALLNVVEQSDVVIWLGDLNYRVELPRSSVLTAIKNNRLQEVRCCPLCNSDARWFSHLFVNVFIFFIVCISPRFLENRCGKYFNSSQLMSGIFVWQLWAKDQLSTALRKGQAFKGFQEGPLLFPPTFKYDVGTNNYDTSIKVCFGHSLNYVVINV